MASLVWSQETVNLNAAQGDTTPRTQDVTLDTPDAQPIAFTLVSDAPWLTVNPVVPVSNRPRSGRPGPVEWLREIRCHRLRR